MANTTLSEWLDNHNITYTLRKDILVIPEFGRCLIQEDYDHIFRINKSGEVIFNSIENIQFLLSDEIYYVVFPFGNRWFYVDIREDSESFEFRLLRHVGPSPKFKHACEFYPLGIHSGYELLNGSGVLEDWSDKARFLGYQGLSVCEKNTLASSLKLQSCAASRKLRFCFGYATTMCVGNDKIGIKIYSATQKGFKNLLRIQKVIGVDNVETKEISMLDVLQYAEGNVLVFDKWTGEWLANKPEVIQDFLKAFEGWVYFQVDTTEYRANRIDSVLLKSLKAYFDAYYKGGVEYDMDLRPILIQDSYYIDKEDWITKIILNKVDTGAAHEQSHAQYLKTIDELYAEFRALFSDKYSDEIFYDMCASTADIMENATAAYDLTANYAPKYDMTAEEKLKYGDTLNMFRTLIEEGFKRLVPEDEIEAYRERVEYEKYVIESTDNVDYILIQRDELMWAKNNGVLPGIGRGSAGGSLLLYLIGITAVDPIKYNLLFERFLLPERAGLAQADVTKMMPAIESDRYVEIECEDGKKVKFDMDAQFMVIRDKETICVYADELQAGDEILWDRRDELFNLNF